MCCLSFFNLRILQTFLENVDITFSGTVCFWNKQRPTKKIERLQSQIIFKVLEAIKQKDLHMKLKSTMIIFSF